MQAYSVITMSEGLNPFNRNGTQEGSMGHIESPQNRIEVVKRILELTHGSEGISEERLMYGAYLSYLQIDEYLSLMLATGLLRYSRETKAYRISAKGIDFLTSLRQMDYLIKSIDE
ncbi:MAG: winged helix-turn-helix domain-containing protein [Nitrososphaera sp.]